MTTPTQISCLICRQPLTLRLAKGRKSGKSFLMLICTTDGRHFRGFINDQAYVRQVLDRLEGQTSASERGTDVDDLAAMDDPSKTNLEGRHN